MAYLEVIKRGNKNFYYLTQTLRIKNKFRKIRRLLSKGDIPQEQLLELAKEAETLLNEEVKQTKSISKIIQLNKETLAELEQVKIGYKRILEKLSPVEYSVIEKEQLIRFTFNTNAIEGSTISLKDTAHILNDGISPEGKELREIYEVENTKKAYEFMKKHKNGITLNFILELHYKLAYNILGEQAGKFRRLQVYMGGSRHVPPPASAINAKMGFLLNWLRNHSKLHPVILGAYFHHLFIAIHPFIDGNGRTGRLLLNLILMKNGFPPICIKKEERIKYTNYLELARDGDMAHFLNFIILKVKEAYALIVDNTS